MIKMNYSKDILNSAYANIAITSSMVLPSVSYCSIHIEANTLRYPYDIGFGLAGGLTTILLSSNQAHPDKNRSKNKSKSRIMSIFFIWSIITFIGNFVNRNYGIR